MIKMKELGMRFANLLNNVEDKKLPSGGIQIPYPSMAQMCVEFQRGECYSFFGTPSENALSVWRLNLLWQLSKAGVSVHILDGGKQFDKDFSDLLCLHAGVDRVHWNCGRLTGPDFRLLSAALEEICRYLVTWHTDENIPSERDTLVCFKTVSLEEWQHYETTIFWPQLQERNIVLFLFVWMNENETPCWNNLYARDHILLPEERSSYYGFVEYNDRTPFDLSAPKEQLQVLMKKPLFLTPQRCLFDYNPNTLKLRPSENF